MNKTFFNNERYRALLTTKIVRLMDEEITNSTLNAITRRQQYKIRFNLNHSTSSITGIVKYMGFENECDHLITVAPLYHNQFLEFQRALTDGNVLTESLIVIEFTEDHLIILIYFGLTENEYNMLNHIKIPRTHV